MRRLLIALVAVSLLSGCASSRREPEDPHVLAEHAHALTGAPTDYDALLSAMDGAALVLLGEATHGTHEFYVERAKITRRLIAERNFRGLTLEADWADAARVNAYVQGVGHDRTAFEALGGFTRFPRWMWRNREFADLVQWIREYNDSLPPGAVKVGIFGLDLYGFEESLDAVVTHLRNVDPAAAAAAQKRLACFAPYRTDPERYGSVAAATKSRSCAAAANATLEAASKLYAAAPDDDKRRLDELFAAEQNARVVRNAEEYYREQAIGRVSTWNLRDRHMVSTMDHVQRYLLRRNGRDHMIVWAHNSHVGDARATDRARAGEYNMGQLVREAWRRGLSFTVGFSTFSGEVVAAHEWGSEGRRQELLPAIRGSHGAILHEVGLPAYYLVLRELSTADVRRPREQRAVGVLYLPMSERESHYFTATLAEQFDAVVHVDQTHAVTPLE